MRFQNRLESSNRFLENLFDYPYSILLNPPKSMPKNHPNLDYSSDDRSQKIIPPSYSPLSDSSNYALDESPFHHAQKVSFLTRLPSSKKTRNNINIS